MEVSLTGLPGILLIQPNAFGDARGYFCEAFHAERYAQEGITGPFVQDNVSRSTHGILRGLHLQHPRAQAKLVSVAMGEVFDVAVDVRVGSAHFGAWTGHRLSDENKHQLYIPPGFAHGFVVLSDFAICAYKCTEYYSPADELAVAWNDPAVGIDWPIANPTLSDKDARAPRLAEIALDRLPNSPP